MMKKYIRSADNEQPSAEEKLSDMIDILKDDFNYAVDGLFKLGADGNTQQAIEHASSLSEMINASIDEIAEDIAE